MTTRILIMFAVLSLLTSCQSLKRAIFGRPIPKPPTSPEELEKITIKAALINTFTCEDPIIAEAVQNMFIAEIAELGLTILKEGPADLVITGTITTTFDESAVSKSSSLAWGGVSSSPQTTGGGMMGGSSGNFAHSAGRYVSGVSSLAEFKGQIVASGAHSQSRYAGRSPDAPEEVAQRAAVNLRWKLQHAKTYGKINF